MIWWTGLAPWEFEFPFPGADIAEQRDVDVDGGKRDAVLGVWVLEFRVFT